MMTALLQPDCSLNFFMENCDPFPPETLSLWCRQPKSNHSAVWPVWIIPKIPSRTIYNCSSYLAAAHKAMNNQPVSKHNQWYNHSTSLRTLNQHNITYNYITTLKSNLKLIMFKVRHDDDYVIIVANTSLHSNDIRLTSEQNNLTSFAAIIKLHIKLDRKKTLPHFSTVSANTNCYH